MQNFLLVAILFSCICIQGAATVRLQPKIIHGLVMLDSTHCDIASENDAALMALYTTITGRDIQPTARLVDKSSVVQQIVQKTGLPLELADPLISLRMDDATAGETKTSLIGDWYHYNYLSSQLKDGEGKCITICRMWPYRWFMHAKEGDAVHVPLWDANVVAHLHIAPKTEQEPFPFHVAAALSVGYLLALRDHAEKQDLVELKKGISIWRLHQKTALRAGAGLEHLEIIQMHLNDLSDEIALKERLHALHAVKERYGIQIDL